MDDTQAKALRAPFPDSAIGKLPKAGIQLDYIGHAAVTDRLLAVDPEWTWEPCAFAANGTPLWTVDGNSAVMWIRLTVCGVSRLGVGICKDTAFELEKQLISDALRNAAMRFGVALDLWSKEDLHASQGSAETGTGESGSAERKPRTSHEPPVSALMSAGAEDQGKSRTEASPVPSAAPAVPVPPSGATAVAVQAPTPAQESELSTDTDWHPPAIELHDALALSRSLIARKVSVFDMRYRNGLPKLDENCDEGNFRLWQRLLADLDTANPVKANA